MSEEQLQTETMADYEEHFDDANPWNRVTEYVKDAQRGEADSLTGTGGCATRRTACKSPVNPGTLPNGIPEIAVIY